MFKWVLLITLALSAGFCAWREYEAQRRLAQVRADIVRIQEELRSRKAIDDDVQRYVRQKDALQKRIDAINQQKMHQKGVADAIDKLAAVDSAHVESVAVVNHDLVMNRR